MKKLVHPAYSMTMINPPLTKTLSIEVCLYDGNEGPIPHVHVYHDKTRNPRKCSVVRLDKAEYSSHHGVPVVRMPRSVKKQFIQVMKEKWSKFRIEDAKGNVYVPTGYDMCVQIWTNSFEDDSYDKFVLDENGVPVMPDYSVL